MKNCRHWCCLSIRTQKTRFCRDKCATCSDQVLYSACLQCASLFCILHYRQHGRLAGHHLSLFLEEEGVWCEKCGKKVAPDDKKTTDLLTSCIARIQNENLDMEPSLDEKNSDTHRGAPKKDV